MRKNSKRKGVALIMALTMIVSLFIGNETVFAADLTGVKEVVTSSQSSYVIKTDDTLWVSGRNDSGQLGDGTTTNVTTRKQVLTDVSNVVLGTYNSAYALKTDGSLWVTGDNLDGQLGDMTSYYRKLKTWKQVMTGVTQVQTSGSSAYALKTDGTLWVAGCNLYGQFGAGTTGENQVTWKQVMTNVSKFVATDSYTAYVLKTDNTLWVAGANKNGQLGDGTTTDVNTWKQVLTGVSQIVKDRDKGLAIKTDGTLWVTGLNSDSQLGDGTTTNVKTWKKVLSGVKLVKPSNYNTYVLKTDGTLWVAGNNRYGQLGDGTTTNVKTWKNVLTGVSKITAGAFSAYVTKTNGTLWATGHNSSGQIGDGTTTTVKTWKQVLTNVSQALSDSSATYVIKTDGSLWVTGSNNSGQLGDGTTTNITTWKQVLTEVNQIEAFQAHNFAYVIKTDGMLWVAGANAYGQLGDGTTTNILSWCPSEAKKLTSIQITTSPTKTTYIEGENFNATGMVVTATYNNGTTAVVAGTVTNGNNLSDETTNINISYTEEGVTKTVTQPIIVNHKGLSSIAITTAPSKTVYAEGENFDATGMVITANYEDGSTAVVTGVVTDGTALVKGASSVTISYTKNNITKSVTQPITVNAKQLSSIAITTAPTKEAYIEGEDFDVVGMVVTATYSNGTKASVTGTVDNGNNLAVGTNSMTISYAENGITKTTTQPITVAAKKLTSIAITTAPTKTAYIEGENFDATGMVITATYNNGITAAIFGALASGNNLAVGTTSVAISYTQAGITKTITQPITVTGKSISNTLLIDCIQGKDLFVPFSVIDTKNLKDTIFSLKYDVTNLELIDIVSQTKAIETTPGIVVGSEIEILSYTSGEIKFKVNKTVASGKTWSGTVNIFKFRAKITGETSVVAGYN